MNVVYGLGYQLKPLRPGGLIATNLAGDVGFHVPDRSPKAIALQIAQLTKELLALPADKQTVTPPTHTFIDGVYTRSLFIAKGTIVVGQAHRKECVNIVAQGDISVLTVHGLARLKAGYVGVSQPSTHKVGYAHADTIFINVFRTDTTDLVALELELATKAGVLCQ